MQGQQTQFNVMHQEKLLVVQNCPPSSFFCQENEKINLVVSLTALFLSAIIFQPFVNNLTDFLQHVF